MGQSMTYIILKSKPWNVDIESLSNLKLKLSLIKSPPIDPAYQLYFHLCDNDGLYVVPMKWHVLEQAPY